MTSRTERALRGALLFCLAAGAAPARAAEPIVIGEINPLTGALALQGATVHQGIVLAIEEQNARGGIAGRRAGIRVLVYDPLAAGLTDFGPLLRHVGGLVADVLVSNTFFADHLVLVRQMTQGGIRLRAFLGAFGMEFPDVIRSLGPAAEGLYGTTAWQPGIAAPGQEAESQAFVEAFAKRLEVQAAPLAMRGHAAARALLAALEAAARSGRPITGLGLRDARAAADVMTPMGRARFDERGDPVSYERVILQIQDGRHVVVWPKERARAAAR